MIWVYDGMNGVRVIINTFDRNIMNDRRLLGTATDITESCCAHLHCRCLFLLLLLFAALGGGLPGMYWHAVSVSVSIIENVFPGRIT